MKKIFYFLLMAMVSMVYAQNIFISQVVGKVEVLKSETNKWYTASVGGVITSKDKIRTLGEKSRCVLMLENGSVIYVSPNTEILLEKLLKEETQIKLEKGRTRAKVSKLKSKESFQLHTPVAVVSIRGTDFSVEHSENNSVVEVYEGEVEVKEVQTGQSVYVGEGKYTNIFLNQPPLQPVEIPQEKLEKKQNEDFSTREESQKQEILSEVQREIFYEISRESIISQANNELKSAEYQLGKSIIDVYGKRVRMEEYIVRPTENQFKYVVLNTREDRFDFGKILFTFNSKLPTDLREATRNMFSYEGTEKPTLYLTGVDSVISNTIDQVNEIASQGDMIPNDPLNPTKWNVFFGKYEFYVNQQKRWTYYDNNLDKKFSLSELSYFDSQGNKISAPVSIFEMPSGESTFHFKQKDIYSDGFYITAEDFIINDEGKILTLGESKQWSREEVKSKLEQLNFERVYTSSVFNGRKIDLVYSAKLLSDAGVLTLPNPAEKSR